ncbi:MAG TPA: hypothetical protein VGG51_01050 [Candidatus Cybelea sp.]
MAMLPAERRASLAGQAPVAWAAQRSRVRKWRLGQATLRADSAFGLGEALRELGVAGMSGFYCTYRLGFASDLSRALVALGKYEHAKLGHIALSLYSVLPIFAHDVVRMQKDSEYGKTLLHADPKTVARVREAASARLKQCRALLDCAAASAGHVSRAVWDQRNRITETSLYSGELDFLDQREAARGNRNVRLAFLDEVSFAWRLLLDWAVNTLHSIPELNPKLRNEWEYGLMTLSLTLTSSSAFDKAQAGLLSVMKRSL